MMKVISVARLERSVRATSNPVAPSSRNRSRMATSGGRWAIASSALALELATSTSKPTSRSSSARTDRISVESSTTRMRGEAAATLSMGATLQEGGVGLKAPEWGRRESNPHAAVERPRILSPLRLPVPPRPRAGLYREGARPRTRDGARRIALAPAARFRYFPAPNERGDRARGRGNCMDFDRDFGLNQD